MPKKKVRKPTLRQQLAAMKAELESAHEALSKERHANGVLRRALGEYTGTASLMRARSHEQTHQRAERLLRAYEAALDENKALRSRVERLRLRVARAFRRWAEEEVTERTGAAQQGEEGE